MDNFMEGIIIDKIVADIIEKCSNDTIKRRLSALSQQEKDKRLEGKLNPFEVEDYKSQVKQLKNRTTDLLELMEEYGEEKSFMYDHIQKEVDFLEKGVFDYEKRIYRGYNFNEKVENVPKYNINDYSHDDIINETMADVSQRNVNFGRLEEIQLDNQKKLEFDEDEQDALFEYFRIEDNSSEINSVLDHNYGRVGYESYWDFWEHQSSLEDMREVHTDRANRKIKHMDSAMSKSEGLLQPTILYTGVGNSNIVDIHTRVGDKVSMKSFISASFQEGIAQRYGKEIEGDNLPNLYVRFLTPTGTKGVCANDRRVNDMEYFFEHEYLLDRGQNGTVVGIDYDTGCVTVLLDG